MESRAAGVLLLGVAACGGELRVGGPGVAPAAPAAAVRAGLSSHELAKALFKGSWFEPDVTRGELAPAGPFMPPPPPPVELDRAGALEIEWKLSDAREGPGRWGGGMPDISQRFTLVVHTTPPQRVALGRWHYTMCGLGHSLAGNPDSADSGVASLNCTGNGTGLSFTLARRKSGDTVDIRVHEGSDGLGGPTYRAGVAAQARVPRGRAIHLVRSEQGEEEVSEQDWYFAAE